MSTALVAQPSGYAPALPVPKARASIHRHLVVTMVLAAILVFGIGGWAHFTQISGAVIAPGQLVVETDVKKVQHPTGGIVGELLVREGAKVKAGDVVIRLDQTQTRASLDIIRKAIDDLVARRARAVAERDGANVIAYPPALLARRASDPVVASLVDGETKLFVSRVAGREGQRKQLRERIMQLGQEITGLTNQAAAKDREIALIGQELKGVRELFSKNLVPFSRVNNLERDEARIQGERGQLVASVASAKGKIAETELQVYQIDQEMRTEVGKELAEIRGKYDEQVEKLVAAEDTLKRVEMRAPQDGYVHQMTVHTIGGLVTPNEPAMLIVPTADQLMIEAKIQPQDIDNVRVGQRAVLRFPAFNTRTTPEIGGEVVRVSADVSTDQKTGATYYTSRVGIPPAEKEKLGALRLVPGMPVESYMQIGDRSVMSYLLKPLSDQFAKAWRER